MTGIVTELETVLATATAEQLAAALKTYRLDAWALDALLDFGLRVIEASANDAGRSDAREEMEAEAIAALDADRLADAIAERRTLDALGMLYEARLISMHPKTFVRLAEIRP